MLKNFVYLDTELVNSYVAQIFDGIPKKRDTEVIDGESKENHTEKSKRVGHHGIRVGIPGLLGYDYDLDSESLKNIDVVSQTSAGRELISKVLHDNSHDLLVEHLQQSENLNGVEFFELTHDFELSNVQYLYNIVSSKEYQEFFLRNSINEKLATQKNITDAVKKIAHRKAEEELKAFNDSVSNFRLLKLFFPQENFIVYNDMIIFFKDEFLRDSYSSIKYTYSGKSTVVGLITGRISEKILSGSHLMVETEQAFIDVFRSALSIISPDVKEFKTVTPISWYY